MTGTQMQALYAAQTEQWGESLTFTRGGVSQRTVNAVCDHPSNVYLQQNFFDDNELVSLAQPLVAVYLAGGGSYVPQVLDTFTRDGSSYQVQKIGVWRINNTVIAYLAMSSIPTS